MYKDVRRVRVGNGYFKEFGAGVGVRQGSFLSLLLFINRLEALSREFYLNCPCEMLFVSLFDLILYVPSTIFQLCRDGSSWVEPMCPARINVSCSRTTTQ